MQNMKNMLTCVYFLFSSEEWGLETDDHPGIHRNPRFLWVFRMFCLGLSVGCLRGSIAWNPSTKRRRLRASARHIAQKPPTPSPEETILLVVCLEGFWWSEWGGWRKFFVILNQFTYLFIIIYQFICFFFNWNFLRWFWRGFWRVLSRFFCRFL